MTFDFITYYFIQLSLDIAISILFRLGWVGHFNEKKLEIVLDGLTLFLILLPLPFATIALSLTMFLLRKDIGNTESIKKGWNILFNKMEDIPDVVKIRDLKWLPDKIYSPIVQVYLFEKESFRETHSITFLYKKQIRIRIDFVNKNHIRLSFDDLSCDLLKFESAMKTNFNTFINKVNEHIGLFEVRFNPFLSENSKIQQR